MLTLGEFREFTSGMPEATELRMASIYIQEEILHTAVSEVFSIGGPDGNFVILEPEEIVIESEKPEWARR